MSLSYNNSILAQNISVSGSNTNVSGVLQVNNVNVSINGHTHTASQISDFASAVSGYFPPSGSQGVQGTQGITGNTGSQGSQGTQGITGNTGSQGSQGTQGVTGSNGSQGVQGTQGVTGNTGSQGIQGLTGAGLSAGSANQILYNNTINSTTGNNSLIFNDSTRIMTISGILTATTGNFTNSLQINGTGVSISGHSHTSSNIVDFNSSVSGLLPVKDITSGYDISITNTSGIYSIASTNLVHVDSQQPQGFINRTDSRISVSGNIFTIEPTGSSYSYYNKGIKVVKTSGDSLTIPNLTQINYIHFDTTNNQISNKTTSFDFSSDIPIAYVAWNSGVGPSGQMTFFAEERHGIVMDSSTHKWIHYTFGAQYINGLSIGNYVLGGNGSSNTHATISIGNGTIYQEDIEINITDSSSTDPFCQELSPIAQIPVYYHEGSTGQWVKNTATDYPVKYGANGPQYNLLSGGTWTIPDVSPGGATRYFAVWILATNQIDDPIISIMGQRIDSNQGSAESNNSWGDVNLTNLPLSEVKPLYRLIFAGDSDYTNVPKCRLLSILDIRVAVISTIAGVAQNDHGSLFGLGDDDHSQYLHVDNNRTVNAIHNFVNGLTSNGLINSTSGNFTNLTVNNTGVSLNGHTHSSSDITNFNSSVSGLVNGIYAPLTGTLNQFSSTTSSQLISIISDETGSGLLVFNNSPTFTGTPLVPTANSGTNTNQIASTSFVRTEISNLVASAPSTLDTLNELATALGSDANFSTTIASGLGTKAALSGATFTGNISSPSGSFSSLTVSEKPVINGGYDYEIHVSQVDGDDTTGNGDLLSPVASITKALTLVGSQRKTIIVHPGTYTENPSITVQYTTITGPGLIGGNILLSGTLSTNTGCTIAGIKMTNLTITTPNGTGNVNILNCEISGTLTKSSNADYTVLRLCDYGAASIIGAGLVAIFGGNPNFTTVNNASANVIIKSAVAVAPVLTSGTLSLVDSIVVAAVTNAITSASSSIITLANCQMLTSALSNIAPVVLSGFYSILNCVYDKPNSTLVALSATGGSTNSIDYFQYINADKFITHGGTSSQYLKGDGSLALFPDNIVYTTGNQAISGVKTFSDLPFVNGTGISISGHNHITSNITDFNSSVSGLLPVKNITAGSGISVSSVSGIYTIIANNGSQGTQGITGSQGVQGAQGITGNTGSQGSQGTQGITGNTGSQGVQGTQGITGNIGNQGIQGIQGSYTNIIGGTGIYISSGNGLATINMYAYAIRGYEVLSSGKTLFSVSGGYLVDNLSVYYNGYKLLGGDDFTATNGTTFTLNSTTASGDIVEWVGLGGPPTATFIQGLQGTQGSAGPSAGSANQIIYKNTSNNISGNSSFIFNDSTNTMTISGILISTSGSFTNNLAIGSNNLTPTNTLNIINSSNLYLWSTFR
jgi:hypothetical protein